MDELVRKALRFRPYWKNGGGVTVTGGEPLLQAKILLRNSSPSCMSGVHTALDTSGVGNLSKRKRCWRTRIWFCATGNSSPKRIISKNCRADFDQIERFLQLTAMKNVPLWIRSAVVVKRSDGYYGPFAKNFCGSH